MQEQPVITLDKKTLCNSEIMKKNISINISLIIFHIEEDGYVRLKEYLESIQKYFSTFEDSTEIIADIESCIAEIFLSKLKESKQVITNKDVENLVSTMGSIQDFQAIEEQESSTFVEPEEEDKKEKKEDKAEPKRESRKNYTGMLKEGYLCIIRKGS